MPRVPRSLLVLGVLYAAGLAVVAFSAAPIERLIDLRLDSEIHWYVELISNILLFVPVGFVGSVLTRNALTTLAGAAAISGVIEFAQLTLSPARTASASDIAKNVLGAAVGYALGRLWTGRRSVERAPR